MHEYLSAVQTLRIQPNFIRKKRRNHSFEDEKLRIRAEEQIKDSISLTILLLKSSLKRTTHLKRSKNFSVIVIKQKPSKHKPTSHLKDEITVQDAYGPIVKRNPQEPRSDRVDKAQLLAVGSGVEEGRV